MWLLDNNIPLKIASVLKTFSIDCDTSKNRNWTELKNGKLLTVANGAGFTCILTRDKLFRESASKVMKKHPNMAVVLIVLPQVRGRLFVESFKTAWNAKPIKPVPGKMIEWP